MGYVADSIRSRVTGSHKPCSSLAEIIIARMLFPELSSWTTADQISERIPILHSPTRKELNSLILLLCEDAEVYRKTLLLLTDLVPNRECFACMPAVFC